MKQVIIATLFFALSLNIMAYAASNDHRATETRVEAEKICKDKGLSGQILYNCISDESKKQHTEKVTKMCEATCKDRGLKGVNLEYCISAERKKLNEELRRNRLDQ